MDLKNLMLKYLAKQYGISEDAAAELLFKKSEEDGTLTDQLNEEALTSLLEKDSNRVQSLKGTVDKTKIYDEAFAKAKVEVLGKVEKKIAKKFGVEENKIEALVDSIVDAQVAAAAAKGEWTEDKIKAHPVYLALERSKTEEISSLAAAHEAKVLEIEQGFERTKVLGNVKSTVLEYFNKLNPILSKDATKAANQRTRFADLFDSFEYKADNGSFLVMQDGKRLEDNHGNPVSLETLVKQQAEQYYDFAQQGEKGSPGNTGGAGGSLKVPKTEQEFNEALFNAQTAEERAALSDAWEATKS